MMDNAKNLFNQISEIYDKTIPSYIVNHYLEKRINFIKKLLGEGYILDVGCGTGLLASSLEKEGFRVVGMDYSEGMLKQFKRRGDYKTVCGNSAMLPFKDDTFDLSICIVTLHHVADKEAVFNTIAEMIRVVKPGEKVLIWAHNPVNPYWPIFMRRLPQDSGKVRLIYLREIVHNLTFYTNINPKEVKVYRKGFVPDFIPQSILPFFKRMELLLEKLPLIKICSAHNVIVIRKMKSGEDKNVGG